MAGIRINIDVDPMRRFAMKLRRADPATARALRRGVAQAGRLVRDTARDNAAAFSTKIPAEITSSASGVTATIRIGGLGALYERPTGWRHPLFGDRKHWYHEGPHQTLHPALDAKQGEATDMISQAVIDAINTELGS